MIKRFGVAPSFRAGIHADERSPCQIVILYPAGATTDHGRNVAVRLPQAHG
jgi:hypothetical protein